MNELDLAKAIRDGVAPSPSKCGNAWLFAIRISGQGIAERARLGETGFRPAEVWASPEMQQRAAGLPVVLGHPESGLLDSTEYAARTIGAIVLPYVDASTGELWGISRVMDADAAILMATGEFSTSPAAQFNADNKTRIKWSDGVLLIEGNPSLLDHVAVIPNNGDAGGGIWDKGGPGRGIRIDSTQERIVAESKEETTETGKESGEKLDKMLAAMDSMGKSVGALADMCTSIGKRIDALEEKGRETRADMGPVQMTKPDAAEQKETERREASEMTDAQLRCDSVAVQHGKQAPGPMAGERLRAYRERLLRNFAEFSTEFGKADLKLIPDGAVFDAVEARIYADAEAAAQHPVVPPGQLRMRSRREPTGHLINEFHGDINTWLGAPFTNRARFRSQAEIRGAA